MKKTFFAVASVALFGLLFFTGCANNSDRNKVEALPTQDKSVVKTSEYNQFQDIFTPAFQLIWNDFSDKVVGRKVEFIGENPQILSDLNEKRLTENML